MGLLAREQLCAAAVSWQAHLEAGYEDVNPAIAQHLRDLALPANNALIHFAACADDGHPGFGTSSELLSRDHEYLPVVRTPVQQVAEQAT